MHFKNVLNVRRQTQMSTLNDTVYIIVFKMQAVEY